MSNNVEETKIISNIDKISKQIDPNSKKQITELSENAEFRRKVESIKEYLSSYIGQAGLSKEVYDKAKALTSFCNEDYKKLIDRKIELEAQAKKNIELAKTLNEVYLFAVTRENFSEYEKFLQDNDLGIYVDKLHIIAQKDRKSKEYIECEKAVKSKINNLEGNLHIDIDLDRIQDKQKALSYISIELDNVLAKLADAVDLLVEIEAPDPIVPSELVESYVPDFSVYGEYVDDSLKPLRTNIWDKLVNSKFVAGIKNLFAAPKVKALNAGAGNAKIE